MSDTGRRRELDALRDELVTDNANRIGRLSAQGINVQIPLDARLAIVVEHLAPPGTLIRSEIEHGWESAVSRALDEIEAKVDEIQRQQRMQALMSGVVIPGQDQALRDLTGLPGQEP